jgi:hypothetical protein
VGHAIRNRLGFGASPRRDALRNRSRPRPKRSEGSYDRTLPGSPRARGSALPERLLITRPARCSLMPLPSHGGRASFFPIQHQHPTPRHRGDARRIVRMNDERMRRSGQERGLCPPLGRPMRRRAKDDPPAPHPPAPHPPAGPPSHGRSAAPQLAPSGGPEDYLGRKRVCNFCKRTEIFARPKASQPGVGVGVTAGSRSFRQCQRVGRIPAAPGHDGRKPPG